jgi:RNA polymerase sigma factor (sigma-70 family)
LLNDQELVDLARSGDKPAFGELVRRHRAKAYSWAQSIAKDHHLADDIVQEALIRAFLRLGTLENAARFIPWLRRIVQNQSMMKVRRGGVYAKETPFSSYVFNFDSQDGSFDIYSLIQQVTNNIADDKSVELTDPSVILLRKETMEMIQHIIMCLNPKERSIFSAYFLGQLSAHEISQQYNMTTNHVHMLLTRTKRKLKKERLSYMLDQYTSSKGKGVNTTLENVLKKPRQTWDSWTSSAACMQINLEFRELNFTLADIMGYTSLAFRINVFENSINVAGPHVYDWRDIHTRGLSNLGVQVRCFGSSIGKEPTPETIIEALHFIHQSIDCGYPLMSWDLFIPEFGLIYGYDDNNKMLYAIDTYNQDGQKTLPYSHLGNGLFNDIYLMEITGFSPIKENEALRKALEMVLHHAYHQEQCDYMVSSDPSATSVRSGITFNNSRGSTNGLAAYDAWIRTFENLQVEELGNAYNSEIISEARENAAQFLSNIADRASDEILSRLAREAAVHYHNVADSLRHIREMFPFPQGGNPNGKEEAVKAASLLRAAKIDEQIGLEKLNCLHNLLLSGKIYYATKIGEELL